MTFETLDHLPWKLNLTLSWTISQTLAKVLDIWKFEDFLKILTTYKLKWVARWGSNFYYDSKEQVEYRRKETTAEHVYSSLKLADYFTFSEEEFKDIDRLQIYDMLMYHDDIEILSWDVSISEDEKRKDKEKNELEYLPILADKYPIKLKERLLRIDKEYRENKTPTAKFAHAIDKMDALVHELDYPQDWWAKWFTEETVRKWFQPAFEYSPTFMKYFEAVIIFLRENGYF